MTTFAGRGVGVAVGVAVGRGVAVAVAVTVGVVVGVRVAVAVAVGVAVGVSVARLTRARAADHGAGASALHPETRSKIAENVRHTRRLKISPRRYFALYNGQDENSSRVHM